VKPKLAQHIPCSIDLVRDLSVGELPIAAEDRDLVATAFPYMAVHEVIREIETIRNFEPIRQGSSILHVP